MTNMKHKMTSDLIKDAIDKNDLSIRKRIKGKLSIILGVDIHKHLPSEITEVGPYIYFESMLFYVGASGGLGVILTVLRKCLWWTYEAIEIWPVEDIHDLRRAFNARILAGDSRRVQRKLN